MHPDDLVGGFSDFEMIWLLYRAGAATEAKEGKREGRKEKKEGERTPQK